MVRLKRKYKIAIIAIISAVVILSFPPLYFFVLNSSQISYGTLPFDKNKELLFLNDTLLWDTGAFGSIIYGNNKDKIPNKTQVGFSLTIDAFKKMQLERMYFSKQHTLVDSFNIYNFFFRTLKNNPIFYKDKMGIMGMDIISTANWLIDFTSGKIEISSHGEPYETKDTPLLNLKYKQNKKPKTQLDFSVCRCEKVLIDAGFTEELTLLSSDIEKINKTHCPIDTFTSNRYSIYSIDPVIQNGYIYDTLIINDICFKNIQILEGNQRLIGFKFFKRFDKVFLDTKEKEFRFY